MVPMKQKGKLFVITGPSGVGKGTVLGKFFEKNKEEIIYSISATTRKARPGEVDGVNYFFISKEEFEKEIENGEFLEWANYSGNYYGTKKSFVEKTLNKGINVLLEIEAQGAHNVMQSHPECVSIFIAPPNLDELEKRLRGRNTESEEAIISRLNAVKRELEEAKNFKYIITNNEVEQAFLELQNIYEAQKNL